MDCSLLKTQFDKYYAVISERHSKPLMISVCAHCAETWAKEHLLDKYAVVPLGFDVELVGDFPDNSFDIVKISGANNAAC